MEFIMIMKRFFYVCLAFSLAYNAFANVPIKKRMANHIESIQSIIESSYAPKNWKNRHFGWSLQHQVDAAKRKIESINDITVKDYHGVLRDFFYSMKDYHVGFRFFATESSSLPFMVKGAQGRFFIAYINRDKLGSYVFPFEVGDEVLTFDNTPVGDLIKDVRKYIDNANEGTDQALAEIFLTRRSAAMAMPVPRGPVTVMFKTKAGKIRSHELIWDYTPEIVKYKGTDRSTDRRFDLSKELDGETFRNLDDVKKQRIEFISKMMFSYNSLHVSRELAGENRHGLGTRQSYIPDLGKKIWESRRYNPFYAYIYKNKKGKKIGYIRVPHFVGYSRMALEFGRVIEKFEKETDGLVIDQINNPGGSVFYLYALASMLSDDVLVAPRHRMTISPVDVFWAIKDLKLLTRVETDRQARGLFGTSMIQGYPISLQFVKFLTNYYRFIIDQWNAGNVTTDPYFLFGVNKINAHAKVNYTKKILMVVNSLDFSGGDFFPAILQDNKRVKILGTRTAGAGGYVLKSQSHNEFGLDFFSFTGSLAERVDKNPIENLGVTPEIRYDLTANDLQNNYVDYVAAIKKAMDSML